MELLPAWMFLALTILLMAGFPVTFTLLGTALFFGLIGFGWDFFNLLPLRIWGRMTNVTLIAVPLFVFMGVMLERSGLAEELLDTMGMLFGRLRGGLAISVVVVGALLGASTGIVGATVVTMGLLAVPTMLRRGYQKELATGTMSASGTLGQIIPPSIVLVLIGYCLYEARGCPAHPQGGACGVGKKATCIASGPRAYPTTGFHDCGTGFHLCRDCITYRGCGCRGCRCHGAEYCK